MLNNVLGKSTPGHKLACILVIKRHGYFSPFLPSLFRSFDVAEHVMLNI